MLTSTTSITRRSLAAAALTLSALALTACNASYSADVVNKTPQPLFVQMFVKGNTDSSLAASKRLGPGDRGFIGPVVADKNRGAYIALDTLPNPGRPTTLDLPPGTTFLEVRQDSESASGPLIVIQK